MKLKKLFAIVVSMAIIASFAVPTFAGMVGEDYGEIPMAATAPVIDGQMDDVYNKGLYFPVDHLRPGDIDTNVWAECWVVWNGDYLYVYFKVEDPDIVMPDRARTKKAWEYDSAEFFIDYSATGSYVTDSNDFANLTQVLQFRTDVSGYPTSYGYKPVSGSSDSAAWKAYGAGPGDVGCEANENGLYAGDIFESAIISSTEMYTVEFKLPLSNVGITPLGECTITPGVTFSIGVQINDEYSGRKAEELSLYRLEGIDNSAWEAQYFPNVVLGETVVEGEEPADDPADDPVDDPADDPVDDPADDPADEPVDDPADDPVDDPADDPADDPVDDPADDPVDDPVDEPVDDPADDPVDDPADEPVDDPADEPVDDPADDPVDDPADDPADEPVDEPTDDPADEPVDDPADEPADEPADDPVEDPVADDPADDPADEPSEPVDSDVTEEPSKLGTPVIIGIVVAVVAVIAVVVIVISKKKK